MIWPCRLKLVLRLTNCPLLSGRSPVYTLELSQKSDFQPLTIKLDNIGHSHYYKNVDLSRLGNRCCPGFPTGNASPGQKGVPFCPGSGNRDRRGPFVPVGNTNRDKRCSQRPRGWRTLLSRLVRSFFFMFSFSQFFFYFNYTFAFQLNLCIGIQCV